MEELNLFYETRDLYEAAAIHSLGYPVIGVKRDKEGMCHFMFDSKSVCEKVVHDFRNRQLMVNAKALIESIKTIKDFIYSGEGRK